jgi:hypothetical protein
MSATATVAGLVEYFIRKYSMPQKTAESMKRNPTLRLMKRDDTMLQSEAFYVTVKAHQAYSGAHDFTSGMADHANSKPFRFLVSGPKTLYARITVEGLLLATQSLGALIDVKGGEMDDIADGLLARIEKKLWSDEYDDLGRVATGGLSGSAAEYVVTLGSGSTLAPGDVYNFMRGMYIEAFSTRNTAATTPRADKYQVTALDPANGKITLTRTTDGSDPVQVGDYLFVRGDRIAVTGGLSFPGITAFIPATDPTDTFLGVARSGQGAFVSGWRFAYQGSIKQTIKNSFMYLQRWVQRPGARFTVCLSALDWYRLELEMDGDVIRNPQAQQLFGTESIMVRTNWGLVDCITIPVLRDGRMYFIDWSTWTLHHLKGIPHVYDDDGQVAVRLGPGSPSGNTTNGDGVEIRFRAWVHPMCDYPIANGTAPTN